jgi:hypothetical protein
MGRKRKYATEDERHQAKLEYDRRYHRLYMTKERRMLRSERMRKRYAEDPVYRAKRKESVRLASMRKKNKSLLQNDVCEDISD